VSPRYTTHRQEVRDIVHAATNAVTHNTYRALLELDLIKIGAHPSLDNASTQSVRSNSNTTEADGGSRDLNCSAVEDCALTGTNIVAGLVTTLQARCKAIPARTGLVSRDNGSRDSHHPS
jgi:hypothetical protein